MTLISSEDTKDGNRLIPRIKLTITWLVMNSFTIIIPDVNNYPMDGLSNNKQLDQFIKKQTLQMSTIWDGFNSIVLTRGDMNVDTCIKFEITDETVYYKHKLEV